MREFMKWGVVAGGLVAVVGCSNKGDVAGSPEDVYRRFMLANLTGSEQALRPLILEHPDAALLWSEGAYPPEVAEALAQNTRKMAITRIEEEPDRVVLRSSDSPIPLQVRRVNGEWRLDASPIIEFRKQAAAARAGEGDPAR
jgi:hypothetical protein